MVEHTDTLAPDDLDSNPDTATDEDDAAISNAPSPPDPHLREISPLASWTVSTYKPGCGVAALLSPSTASFWQSDGPQPHLLNIHFFKLVHIVWLRVYLDCVLDESYTPTRMVFAAGMGEYDLCEFAEWKGEAPRGWVDVGLEGCGGGEGEGEEVLRCMCLQLRVLENHQNGKDTHIRGVQIYARDERARGGGKEGRGVVEEVDRGELVGLGEAGLEEPDWMGEPELR